MRWLESNCFYSLQAETTLWSFNWLNNWNLAFQDLLKMIREPWFCGISSLRKCLKILKLSFFMMQDHLTNGITMKIELRNVNTKFHDTCYLLILLLFSIPFIVVYIFFFFFFQIAVLQNIWAEHSSLLKYIPKYIEIKKL